MMPYIIPIRRDSCIDNLIRKAEIRRIDRRKRKSDKIASLYESARATEEQAREAYKEYKRTKEIFGRAMAEYNSSDMSFTEAYDHAISKLFNEVFEIVIEAGSIIPEDEDVEIYSIDKL